MLPQAVTATIVARRRAVDVVDAHAATHASCIHGRRDARVLGRHSPTSSRAASCVSESRLEGVNKANLKFINLSTTTSRVSVRDMNESEREGEKQIASK
jgi:hypothetical protein